ncbi:MAG: 2-deoxyribonucleoside glycosidase [Candidatus Dadabacteria bacterium]|nr:2-deoxyribonucleoside glycosidase [Candidatus Dadabacteria bacterium]NIQ14972.1 2-deoxyribonucleoside glycosidase [Candidatus Dadabacteria bacterium]
MKKIYIASPYGFSEASKDFYYDKIIPILENAGFEVIDPWTLTPSEDIKKINSMAYGIDKKLAWEKQNIKIAEKNIEGIDNCDYMLAILDGVDVDSGTASEIGYAFALGKKILGYRGDFRLSSDNEGSLVNLQVEYFIRESGGMIVTSYEDIVKNLLNY